MAKWLPNKRTVGQLNDGLVLMDNFSGGWKYISTDGSPPVF